MFRKIIFDYFKRQFLRINTLVFCFLRGHPLDETSTYMTQMFIVRNIWKSISIEFMIILETWANH